MKPAADAVKNWAKELLTNKEFSYSNFKQIKYNSFPTCYQIEIDNIPNYNNANQKFALYIQITSSETLVSTKISFEYPDIYYHIKYKEKRFDNRKEYTHLKCKDLIEFKKLYSNYAEQNENTFLRIHYINPKFHDNFNYDVYMKENKQYLDRFIDTVESLFAFLDKREKQNQELKKIKSDFK